MNILENQSLHMKNVLSYRGKITQSQINQVMQQIGKDISQFGAEKNGDVATVTFAVDTSNGQPLIDIEILVPLSQPVDFKGKYTLKPVFKLDNAVKIRHEGNPAELQNSVNELLRYISKNGLTPITQAYNVTITSVSLPHALNEVVVDVYIGVSKNIL